MLYRIKCNTVGELREALKHWPNEKSILIDSDGNTYPVEVYEWSDVEPADLDWPAAIDANFGG